MRTRDTQKRNRPLLVASSITLAAGLFLFPLSQRPQEPDRMERRELTTQSYVALHDGWLYFKSDQNLTSVRHAPSRENRYVYRVPLEGGAPVLFARLPPSPVRSPAEYCLPSNDFKADETGLHYVEYKLRHAPAPGGHLSPTPAGDARVYTYPWGPLASTVTPVPTTGGIVEVLRVSARQVLYQERAPVPIKPGALATRMSQVPMRRVPLADEKTALKNAGDRFNDVLLRPIRAEDTTPDGTTCPEQTGSGFWWIRPSDGKLCRITARDNQVQVVEPPLRYDITETLKCLWLRRSGERVYLRCDIERGEADKKTARAYLLRLPDQNATMPSSWGAPILLAESLRYADTVFLENGWAYFICNENSRQVASWLQSFFRGDHREPVVGALYRVHLPR